MKLSKGNESFSEKQKRMSLIEFTMNVSSSLLKNAKPVTIRKPGRPSSSSMEGSTTSKRPRKAPDLKEVTEIQDLITLITGLCIEMKDPGAFSAKRKLDGVA